MAKKPKTATAGALNMGVLMAIANSTEGMVFLSQADAQPFLDHSPQLIEVNTGYPDPNDANKRAARLTEAGKAYISNPTQTAANPAANNDGVAMTFEIKSGGVFPEPKRGKKAGNQPSKYPFAQLDLNQFFFVADEGDKKAAKMLGALVSNFNAKHSQPTGQMIDSVRAKKGADGKPIVGADGKKEMETVKVPEKRFTTKLVVRQVTAGEKYGEFIPPSNGAVVVRTQ